MKKISTLLFVVFVTILFTNCDESQLIGAEDVIEYSDIKLEITDYSYTSNSLTANRICTNEGDETIFPIWYVEGDFKSTDAFTLKLGGFYEKRVFL